MATVSCEGYSGLNIRKSSKKDSEIVGILQHGAEVEIESTRAGMGKLADGSGWVNMDFIEKPIDEH